ncbi:Alpha/beta hydrolase fold-1 [Mycena epipterygia]|nr:Alpha/beta hydrolase fold-1 [Mycena epipterygia]
MALDIVAFTFDCPPNPTDAPGQILKMTAKRYRAAESLAAGSCPSEGLTLLFAHGIGGHKEQWEPIISYIFAAQRGKARQHQISEAWALDWQSHGDAGVLNEAILKSGRPDGLPAAEWGPAILAFVRSPHMQGRRIVPIGHSAGAGTLAFTAKDMDIASIPYVAFVLIEASVANREIFNRIVFGRLEALTRVTKARRALWKSREEAYQWLKTKSQCKSWDPRVLRIFIEHALADTPTGEVKLKCDPYQEAMAYPEVEAHFIAIDQMRRLHNVVPFHFVWATRSEVVPKEVNESLADVAASTVMIEGGHMIVQQKPDDVALTICCALDTIGGGLARL